MTSILLMVHVLVCFALIGIVLLQKGKGAGMGAAFGGSSQTVFGSAGASTFLAKVTTVAAVLFMLTSLGLSIFLGQGGPSSVMEGVTQRPGAATEQPSTPAAPPGTESAGGQQGESR